MSIVSPLAPPLFRFRPQAKTIQYDPPSGFRSVPSGLTLHALHLTGRGPSLTVANGSVVATLLFKGHFALNEPMQLDCRLYISLEWQITVSPGRILLLHTLPLTYSPPICLHGKKEQPSTRDCAGIPVVVVAAGTPGIVIEVVSGALWVVLTFSVMTDTF